MTKQPRGPATRASPAPAKKARQRKSSSIRSSLSGQPVPLSDRSGPLRRLYRGCGRGGADKWPEPLRHEGRRVQDIPRSEEHTSELQSRPHLVCRLLLEKKKKTK